MKDILKSITSILLKPFKIIFNFFKIVVTSIYLVIKKISIKIGRIIKYISLIIWKYFLSYIVKFISIIGLFTFNVVKSIFNFIKKIAIKIWTGFLNPLSNWFLSKIIIPIYKFVINMFKTLFRGIKNIGKWLWDKFFLKIYKVFKYIFIKLFNFFINFFKYIKEAVIYLYEAFINFFKMIYKIIKYIYYYMPDFLHTFISFLYIYSILLIKFIFIDILKIIFIDIIYKVLKFIFNLFLKFINYIKKLFIYIFDKIKFIFWKLGQKILVLWHHFRDFLEYSYIIILIPIILPIFLILFILTSVILIFNFLNVFIKSLLGFKIFEPNEVIYFRLKYNPIKYFYHNLMAYNNILKYKYHTTKRFISLWYLIKSFSWQILYILIFSNLFMISLIPITLISLLFVREINLDNKIITRSNKAISSLRIKPIKYKGTLIDYQINTPYFINPATHQIIFKDLNKDKIIISLFYNNQLIKDISFDLLVDDYLIASNIFENIKKDLINKDYYHFELPKIKQPNFKVKYETNYNRDKILNNKFIIRSISLTSSIKVIILNKKDKVIIEDDIKIRNIINPNLFNRITNKVINVKTGESLIKYLPKKYNYYFIESKQINKFGKVITKDDGIFEAQFYLEKREDQLYKLELLVIAPDKRLNLYLEQLNNNFIDHENNAIKLLNIKRDDETIREVSWYYNYQELNEKSDLNLIYYKIMTNQSNPLSVIFRFNNSYVKKEINKTINNKAKKKQYDYIFKEKLSLKYNNKIKNDNRINVKDNLFKLGKKNYIKLPIFSFSNFMIIRWKTLNKDHIKNNGLIINDDFNEVKMIGICYYGLFNKIKYEVYFVK